MLEASTARHWPFVVKHYGSQGGSVNVTLAARYERAMVYAAMGDDHKARKELESIYALQTDYRDVAERPKGKVVSPIDVAVVEMPLGYRVRDLRRRAGLTQTELHRRSGISRQTIGLIEAGRVVPKASTLETLMKACGAKVPE